MASGDTLVTIDAIEAAQPSTGYASRGQVNDQPHIAFDNAVSEAALFRRVMPSHYSGGGVTVILHWRSASGTGNVTWTTAFELQADGGQNTTTDGFASANSGTFASAGTAGILDYASIAHTDGAQMDGVVAGSVFRLKVTRTPGGLAADAQLVSIEIRET